MSDMAALWAAQEAQVAVAPEFVPGNLATKFVEPPFSVLDTRGARWQERRRSWLSLGVKSELGRGEDLLALAPAEGARARWAGAMRSGEGRELEPGAGNARTDYGAYQSNEEEGAKGGTSIFDPVLTELAYRWWAPEGGAILDPFAGGSVRGIVAAKLGHRYTGIDLSGAQLEANRGQAAEILSPEEPQPAWLHGDSRRLEDLLPAGELYDMVFSCPPYFDLEVYSDHPADLSAMSWHDFLTGYEEVIERAAQRLLPERFAVFVVSEIRDPEGYCRGLVPRTVHAFERVGLRLYNEAVLINSAGSLPLRVTKYMEASRKLGRAHQNVLCFLKGKPPRGWSYDRAAPPSPQLDLHLALEPAPSQPPLASTAVAEEPAVREGAEEVPDAPGPSDTSNEPGTAEWAAEVAAETAQVYVEAALELEVSEGEYRELEPEQPCSRPYCILPAGHAMGHNLVAPEDIELSEELGEPSSPRGLSYDQLEDGRWVDNATGELFEEAPDGGRGQPYHPPAGPEGGFGLQPEPGVGGVPAVGPRAAFTLAPSPPWQGALSEPPMRLDQWLASRSRLYDAADPARPCWGCGRPPIGTDRDGGPQYERHSHAEEGRP